MNIRVDNGAQCVSGVRVSESSDITVDMSDGLLSVTVVPNAGYRPWESMVEVRDGQKSLKVLICHKARELSVFVGPSNAAGACPVRLSTEIEERHEWLG
jgi:hypothetical protein